MVSKVLRIAGIIVLVTFAFSVPAGASCSNASLNGAYGFLHDSTDASGTPSSAAVSQLTFDPATGTFSGQTTTSRDGVISTLPLSGTYSISSSCIGTGTPSGGAPFSIVVTPTGFLAVHLLSEGFAVKQGSPACHNADVDGKFAFEATGVYLAGAPVTGAVNFIGKLRFTAQTSGEGAITGHVVSAVDGSSQTFAEEPVTGSYSVDKDCMGTATITPEGQPEIHFNFVVADCGKEMLAVETDANTVVSATLIKQREDEDQPATPPND